LNDTDYERLPQGVSVPPLLTQWADGQKIKPTRRGLAVLQIVTQDEGAMKGKTAGCDVCFLPIFAGEPKVILGWGRYHSDCVDWSD
jgi:hypothetical protein